jgi:hypothetical protein
LVLAPLQRRPALSEKAHARLMTETSSMTDSNAELEDLVHQARGTAENAIASGVESSAAIADAVGVARADRDVLARLAADSELRRAYSGNTYEIWRWFNLSRRHQTPDGIMTEAICRSISLAERPNLSQLSDCQPQSQDLPAPDLGTLDRTQDPSDDEVVHSAT